MNPNQATGASPDQLLANALTVTAASYVDYNTYGNFMAGLLDQVERGERLHRGAHVQLFQHV
ncbi:MAG: hypothetical protein WKG07_28910 [Hymenobacter sp.]